MEACAVSATLDDRMILAGVNFFIRSGEVVGLVGPNGAGKTTLLRVLSGLLPPTSGEITLQDRPLTAYQRKVLAKTLAYLPQSGESHWSVSVENLVMLGRLPYRSAWGPASREDQVTVDRALKACDVAQFRRRPVSHLSGGERSRVLLARALASEPKVLLADEPVAGLDPGHQLDVMRRLRDLAASGAGVVVVMHDLTLAARFCDRLALLHDKGIAAEGPPAAVLSPGNLARCYGIRAYYGAAADAIVVPIERIDPDHGTATR